MSSTNTPLNCLFCFNNISNKYYQQNQNYLTPLDIISCCSQHLSKEFIDSLNWTNASSTAGILCQECYNIAERLNNLNIHLDKIFEEINELGAFLTVRVSEERRNYELSTPKPSGVSHIENNNQVSDLLHPATSSKINDPNWKYKVQDIQDCNQIQKDGTSRTGSFNSVEDNLDEDRNGSRFATSNSDADNGNKCELPHAKPIKISDKRGSRKKLAKKKQIRDSNNLVPIEKAVSEREEIITGSELQHHINNGLDSGYKCDKCNKMFSRILILRRHDCSKPTYECEICKISFCTPNLKRHLRTHTGEKPYKCETCGKSFALKCNLTTHIQKHTDERPMKCTFCEKSFRYKYSLQRHLATHENATVTKYKCDICSKFFVCLSDLKRHLPTHSKNNTQKWKISRQPFIRENDIVVAVHPDQVHPKEMSKLDYNKSSTSMEVATFFNADGQTIQELPKEEESQDFCNTWIPLTRMSDGEMYVKAENSKEFESFNDAEDKSENEIDSFSDENISTTEIKLENGVHFKDTEIKLENDVHFKDKKIKIEYT